MPGTQSQPPVAPAEEQSRPAEAAAPPASTSGRPVRQTRNISRVIYDGDDSEGEERPAERGAGGTRGSEHKSGGLQDVEWSAEEQALLEAGMQRFPSEKYSSVQRYIKIAVTLPEKGARDVALRIRYMNKNGQALKKRKPEEIVAAKRTKAKAESAAAAKQPAVFSASAPLAALSAPPPGSPLPQPSTAMALRSSAAQQHPHAHNDPHLPALHSDSNVRPHLQIGGPVGKMLDHNIGLMQKIRQNMNASHVAENTELLGLLRDNIQQIGQGLQAMPGFAQLPPLPVKLNEELANTLLPPHTPTGTATMHAEGDLVDG